MICKEDCLVYTDTFLYSLFWNVVWLAVAVTLTKALCRSGFGWLISGTLALYCLDVSVCRLFRGCFCSRDSLSLEVEIVQGGRGGRASSWSHAFMRQCIQGSCEFTGLCQTRHVTILGYIYLISSCYQVSQSPYPSCLISCTLGLMGYSVDSYSCYSTT